MKILAIILSLVCIAHLIPLSGFALGFLDEPGMERGFICYILAAASGLGAAAIWSFSK